MFKKLQDWLFKEDFEELDIEEKDSYIDEVVYEEKRYTPEPKVSKTIVYEEEIPQMKPQVPKMNIDIKVDDPVVEEKKVEKPSAPVKSRPILTRKEEYEMPPVISPYFGVKGEEAEQSSEKTPTLNKINPKNEKKETFNSVISPFYGQKKSQKPIQQTVEQHNDSNKTASPFIDVDVVDEHEYDEDNISLDEIVSSNEVSDDDLIQFSLFGEDKKILKEEFENEDTEEIDNEELPF